MEGRVEAPRFRRRGELRPQLCMVIVVHTHTHTHLIYSIVRITHALLGVYVNVLAVAVLAVAVLVVSFLRTCSSAG